MKWTSMAASMVVAAGFAFSAASEARAQDFGLVTELAGLGVSQDQAAGGLLAILQLAQSNLGPAEFTNLTGMVPGMGDFMGAAGGGAAAAGAMGAAAGAIRGAAAPGAQDAPATAEYGADAAEHEAHAAEHEAHAAEHEAHAAEHEAHAAEQEAHSAEHEAHAAEQEAHAAEHEAHSVEDCCGGMEGATGSLGAAAAMGGAAAGMPQITGLSELAAVPSLVSAFGGLGMGPEMIQQFAPIILKYVMGSGGSAAAQLLATGLGLGIM